MQSMQVEQQIRQQTEEEEEEKDFDYSGRAQWLRAAVLGANDGLVSIAALMLGVGSVRQDVRAMILTGFAGLVAGACSMAIGEYVSVHSQLDIEVAQMKRTREENDEVSKPENLPNPMQAALASAMAFSLGAMVPVLAAVFIKNHKVRMGLVVAATSVALIGFGGLGAILGKAPVPRSCFRVLLGGWVAMGITFGLTKLIVFTGV